jgi:serine phosphatase RsbU (regulator of sigma subunit)
MHKILTLLFLIILVARPQLLADESDFPRGFPRIANFSPADYDADTQNWDIVQDRQGLLYFGNNLGLLVFDGEDWRLYDELNLPTVRALAIAEDGKIFAGGIGDLGYFFPDSTGALTYQSLVPQIPANRRDFSDVWQVAVIDDNVYFNVETYILIWHRQQQSFSVVNSANTFHLMFHCNGKVFVKEWNKGLQMLRGNQLANVPGGEIFTDRKIYAVLPFADEPGSCLFVTRSVGMIKYDGTTFTPFPSAAERFLRENLVYVPGLVLNDGNFLLGTLNDGAIAIDQNGQVVHLFDHDKGLINPVINSMYQDHSGGIWLATDNGLSRLEYDANVAYFDARSNYSSSAYNLISHRGIIYAATTNGVYFLEPLTSQFQQLANSRNLSFTFLKMEGVLLVGTLDGLYEIEKNRLFPIRLSLGNEYDTNKITRSRIDSNRVFIGAVGLWSMYKQNGHWIDEGNILHIEDIINGVAEDNSGVLWVSSNVSGSYRVRPKILPSGRLEVPATDIQLLDASRSSVSEELFVRKIRDQIFFLGEESFFRYDATNDRFYRDSTFAGILAGTEDSNQFYVREDRWQRLWLSLGDGPLLGHIGENGTYQWLREPFKRFAKEIIVDIYPESKDVVWFSTTTNVIRYDFAEFSSPRHDFTPLLRRVEIKGDSTIFYGNGASALATPQIDYKYNSLRFTFAAPSYGDVEANSYRTFLQGYDERWQGWGSANQKEYTNLAPGQYEFSLQFRNAFTEVSKVKSFRFAILPPWYRTWAAYIAYGLLLALGIFVVDRVQRKRLLAKERAKRKMQAAEHRAENAELRSKAREAEKKALQIENARKSRELEEARKLQLSMLPRDIPALDNLDMAFFMQTATEVGGDYYDFVRHGDSGLRLAIGDATGHGMKAGTMVAMMKTLFTSAASDDSLLAFFNLANTTFKNMQLERVLMGFAMLEITPGQATLINAGMPPLFLYTARDKKVEEVDLTGMPLGALQTLPLNSKSIALASGDALLMLSDGLPELVNADGEMFGYERIADLFTDIGHLPAEAIVEHLHHEGEKWRGQRDIDDDITFIAVKVKHSLL